MTKPGDTTELHKYINSGYVIGFDGTGQFTHPDDGKSARNIIILGVDLSNSRHETNKTKNVLILGHGLTQKVNNTKIYAETFCLSLLYNRDDSYLFFNGKKVTKFKAKGSEIKAYQLALGGISTSANLSSSGIEDSKIYGNVYEFSVDYSGDYK